MLTVDTKFAGFSISPTYGCSLHSSSTKTVWTGLWYCLKSCAHKRMAFSGNRFCSCTYLWRYATSWQRLYFWVQDPGWHLQCQVLLEQALFFMNKRPPFQAFPPQHLLPLWMQLHPRPLFMSCQWEYEGIFPGQQQKHWLDLHQIGCLHLVHIPQVVQNHNLFKLQENLLFPKEASHFLHGLLMVHRLQCLLQ
jgi:hypothetical protein